MEKIIFNMLENEINRNGRVYPSSVIESAINQAKHKIEKGTLFITNGEVENPPEIDLTHIVAKITDIEKKDKDIHIHYDYIENMPLTSIFKELDKLDKVYVTPIGVGSVKNNIVDDDYRLIAFNIDIKIQE